MRAMRLAGPSVRLLGSGRAGPTGEHTDGGLMPGTRVARPLAAIVACTAICVLIARPVAASPVAPQEPGVTPTATATPTPTDSGAPNPTATLPPITAPITAFAGVKGPLAQKILKDEADVEALGQQLQALQQSVDTDAVWTTQAFARWQAAVVVLSQAQNATTDAATKAYENLYALG